MESENNTEKLTRAKIIGIFLLFLSAILWGMSYSITKIGTESISPFAFVSFRGIFGFLSLIPIAVFTYCKNKGKSPSDVKIQETLKAGIICGALLFMGIGFLAFGLKYTSASKAGFITALYITVVPLVGLLMGKTVQKKIWICVLIAVIGLYRLCISDTFSINPGDIFVSMATLGFALHIIALSHFTKKVNNIYLACLQCLVAGLISSVITLIFTEVSIEDIKNSILPLLYGGVCATGMGFTFQTIGQSMVPPEKACLILASESIFASIFGMLLLQEVLTPREITGAILVFIAIVLAQVEFKK